MEKTLEKTLSIIDKNEKVIANILHDVKSPLYSIKMALQTHLETELNKDIFKITLSTIEYIENFLVNYSFSNGNFKNKVEFCNVKEIINRKIESYKYIFIDKKIHIDFILEDGEFLINSNELFLSSIIGNIISNIAFHAAVEKDALIELYKRRKAIVVNFKNLYDKKTQNTSLGLDFIKKFAQAIRADLKLKKTKDMVLVQLKIPDLSR